MSHGGGDDSTLEPNLTPLLDLVLQLLMFFMMCVKFTDAVTNTGERLPSSDAVKPLTRDGTDPLILSIKPFRMAPITKEKDKQGETLDDFVSYNESERERLRARFQPQGLDERLACIVVSTERLAEGISRDTAVRGLLDMRIKINDLAKKDREKKENVDAAGNIIKPVHIRADENVRAGEIYELTQLCKTAGYVNVKVRAVMGMKGRE